jgi:hypothetical protein
MRLARRLARKCRSSTAGQSSHGSACLFGRPSGRNDRRDRHDTSPEHDRRARCEPAYDLDRRKLRLIPAPPTSRRKPNLIEIAATPSPTSRGFLFQRLADASPLGVAASAMAGIRNPS